MPPLVGVKLTVALPFSSVVTSLKRGRPGSLPPWMSRCTRPEASCCLHAVPAPLDDLDAQRLPGEGIAIPIQGDELEGLFFALTTDIGCGADAGIDPAAVGDDGARPLTAVRARSVTVASKVRLRLVFESLRSAGRLRLNFPLESVVP